MAVVTIRQLLDSGVHFGHQTRRWNPKVKRFILTERSGIHIIDLQQSLAYIDSAYDFVKETVARGGTILFVGTKKQAQEVLAEQAARVGQPFVVSSKSISSSSFMRARRLETVWKLVRRPPSQRSLTNGWPTRCACSAMTSWACFFVPTKRIVPPWATVSLTKSYALSM